MKVFKKVISVFALVLICFSAFSFMGCDTVSNSATLRLNEDTFSIKRVTEDNWSSIINPMTTKECESKMEALDAVRFAGFGISILHQIDFVDADNPENNRSWCSGYFKLKDGKWVTDPDGKQLSAYQLFTMTGGKVSGLNVEKPVGKYICTFEYLGAKCPVEITLTD